jgi:hypothetical protein
MRLAITISILAAVIGLLGGTAAARGAAYTCDLNVPTITEQADGTGVQTGHVTGSCSFAWHSRDEIWYKDRWHMLGWNYHDGAAAGVIVSQPRDSEDYGEYGDYREIVSVYDTSGVLRVRVVGAVSTIQ